MILSIQNISKTFIDHTVLKDVSFHIEEGEKAAIIGINGAGKSTLLKIIMKELDPDSGLVTISKDKVVGYLAQHQDVDSELTIYEEMISIRQNILDMEASIRTMEQQMTTLSGEELSDLMERYTKLTHQFELENGYAYKSECVGVLKGLGFSEEDFAKKINTLSGGQKTRVALGRLLLLKPDLIILDEPTNHLDMDAVCWLETYLMNYKGAVILVSHDRFFLDRLSTKIIELENGAATTFIGNYTAYAAKKEILRTAQRNAYLNQQREIKHQEEVIEKLRSFNREKSIKRAESREKMLQKIEVLEKPVKLKDEMQIHLTPHIMSGNDVLSVTDFSKSYGKLALFHDVNFEIKRGEHIAVIGKNGTGKTTLLKILNGLETPDGGSFKLGAKVEIGYYDQEHHVLNMEKTLFDEISDSYPNLTNTQIRNCLAAFLFTGDDVFKRIGDLSGGEKGRISLAKLMLSNANFLILDEPTNHLDITSKEILEDALNNYEGTVLYVSHDRYFVNKTATRILSLSGEQFYSYPGNYDDYLAALERRRPASSFDAGKSDVCTSPTATVSENKQDWQAMKEDKAKKRKRENQLRKTEQEIEVLETRLHELEEEMSAPGMATNAKGLHDITLQMDETNQKLEELYALWETLA